MEDFPMKKDVAKSYQQRRQKIVLGQNIFYFFFGGGEGNGRVFIMQITSLGLIRKFRIFLIFKRSHSGDRLKLQVLVCCCWEKMTPIWACLFLFLYFNLLHDICSATQEWYYCFSCGFVWKFKVKTQKQINQTSNVQSGSILLILRKIKYL